MSFEAPFFALLGTMSALNIVILGIAGCSTMDHFDNYFKQRQPNGLLPLNYISRQDLRSFVHRVPIYSPGYLPIFLVYR